MYENLFEKTLSSKRVFDGKIVNVRWDSVELVNGKTSFREVVEHAGGVVILAVDENNRAYMVRQFRYPIGRAMLEVPAGKLEKGEDPLEGAVRELREETGLTAEQIIYFGGTYPSPGFCDEQLHIYLALGLTQGEACPDEDEFLNLEVIDLDELAAMIMRGELQDGKSINAIFMAREYLRNNQR
ncbi:MAG: NUDIX hydrolase [Oscillospiraceae bacterium]|nr:NUDIX hydrolase [Oscillospiraceae bacterium]